MWEESRFGFSSSSLADDRDSVRVEDHAGRGLVGAGEIVEVLVVSVAPGVDHLLIILHARHQTLVTDRLHVVLIAVRRLVEGTLKTQKEQQTSFSMDKLLNPEHS